MLDISRGDKCIAGSRFESRKNIKFYHSDKKTLLSVGESLTLEYFYCTCNGFKDHLTTRIIITNIDDHLHYNCPYCGKSRCIGWWDIELFGLRKRHVTRDKDGYIFCTAETSVLFVPRSKHVFGFREDPVPNTSSWGKFGNKNRIRHGESGNGLVVGSFRHAVDEQLDNEDPDNANIVVFEHRHSIDTFINCKNGHYSPADTRRQPRRAWKRNKIEKQWMKNNKHERGKPLSCYFIFSYIV